MFDLSTAVNQWRNDLASGKVCKNQDLDELETHLRDQMEALSGSGLSEEEAFWVATHRLGDTGSLKREYAKINASAIWKHRIFWMATGVLGIYLLKNFSWVLSSLSLCTISLIGIKGLGLSVADVLCQILITGSLVGLVCQGIRRKWLHQSFFPFIQRSSWRIILFTGLLMILIFVISFIPTLTIPFLTRYLSPSDYSGVTISRFIGGSIWGTFFPVIWLIIFFKCRECSSELVHS